MVVEVLVWRRLKLSVAIFEHDAEYRCMSDYDNDPVARCHGPIFHSEWTPSVLYCAFVRIMSLLSGIKIGKKKRKDPPLSSNDPELNRGNGNVVETLGAAASVSEKRSTAAPESSTFNRTAKANQSAADLLRAQLATGNFKSSSTTRSSLEQRGRIGAAIQPDDLGPSTLMVEPNVSSTALSSDASQSITDMLREEKRQSMSLADLEARDLLRHAKKGRFKKGFGGYDRDEEEDLLVQRQQNLMKESQSEKATLREAHRAVNKSIAQGKMVSKLWWWIESNQFERRRLVSLGNHVSLSMAPLNLSLIKGYHFYLVPLAHVESLVQADLDVWDEIARFQASLRALFAKENQSLVFFETVLPSNSFWQTRMECVALPREHWLEAQLYIKQALLEQAQDNGTHQRVMPITRQKGLQATVPKSFPYIYMEYDQQQGYAQVIESKDFPKDFAIDTVAGIVQLDPIRFRRRETVTPEEERNFMLNFLEKWKSEDWTLQLDG